MFWALFKRTRKGKELLEILRSAQNYLQINDRKQFEVFKKITDLIF